MQTKNYYSYKYVADDDGMQNPQWLIQFRLTKADIQSETTSATEYKC